MIKKPINIEEFSKLDMRVGLVMGAEIVEGSSKLIQLKVDLGSEVGERIIYAGLKEWYSPDELMGKKLVFVVNLAPKKFKIGGKEYVSEGMLLAASAQGSGELKPVLYSFDEDLPVGSILR